MEFHQQPVVSIETLWITWEDTIFGGIHRIRLMAVGCRSPFKWWAYNSNPDSWPRNVVDPSLVVVLVDLPFLSVVRLILYRCLPIFFPSATCFPSLLVSTSLPLPPLYCPPAASHLPREMRLYFWSGICRTSCKRSLYFFPLHVEIKSTVPRPAILATRPPMPVTDKSVAGTYEVKASLW